MERDIENLVIPQHVALILDGNGRWAKKRGLPRTVGHKQGCVTVEQTVEDAARLGIRYLTVYGFSTENWKRAGMNPKTLQYLMGHSDIGVTLNTYTHLGLEDAADELKRMEELADARKELEKVKGENPVSQKMFRAI